MPQFLHSCKGYAVLCQFVCHCDHVLGAVVGHADALGETFLDAIHHAFGDYADRLNVDRPMDEVDIHAVDA
jgi:hypothetical protein